MGFIERFLSNHQSGLEDYMRQDRPSAKEVEEKKRQKQMASYSKPKKGEKPVPTQSINSIQDQRRLPNAYGMMVGTQPGGKEYGIVVPKNDKSFLVMVFRKLTLYDIFHRETVIYQGDRIEDVKGDEQRFY